MRLLFAFIVLVSTSGFAIESTMPSKIRGALIVTPSELEALTITVSSERKCSFTAYTSFDVVTCEIAGALVEFESLSGKNTVVPHRLVEFHYHGSEPGSISKSFSLLGLWKGQVKGYPVSSPLVIQLNEFEGKTGQYSGFIEFKDYAYNKIPLDARAE